MHSHNENTMNQSNNSFYCAGNESFAKRSPSSYSFRSYEEQSEFIQYKASMFTRMRQKIFCQFVLCFRKSLSTMKLVFLFFLFYMALRTFYEFHYLLLFDFMRLSSVAQGDTNLIKDNVENEVISHRYDAQLNSALSAIRQEGDRISMVQSEVEKIKKECASSIQSFQMSIKQDREQYITAFRDLVVNEYDALRIQRIGKPDYALKELGAKIVKHSPTYRHGGQIVGIWGLPLFWEPKLPEIVLSKLSDSVVPGECWPFEGNMGYILIQLSHAINVTSISYEHASSRLLPPDELRSAPKIVDVWIGQTAETNQRVGSIEYEPRDYGAQTLYLLRGGFPARFVKFHVLSNHGAGYTCLYRVRVHGNTR